MKAIGSAPSRKRVLRAARALAVLTLGVPWPMAAWAQPRAEGLAAPLRRAQVSELELRQSDVQEALTALRAAAEKADPEGVGINIVYRGPPADQVPRITLRLRNVSLYDALRYVTEVAGLRFRIEERAVVITSADAPTGPIITRFYSVQPTVWDAIREPEEESPRVPYFGPRLHRQ